MRYKSIDLPNIDPYSNRSSNKRILRIKDIKKPILEKQVTNEENLIKDDDKPKLSIKERIQILNSNRRKSKSMFNVD